jgi:hypothetical protein
MLTIVSLTVFWLNGDYCFIDCTLVQCLLLFHWLYFGSMVTIVSLTILVQCWLLFHWLYFAQNTVSETIVNIEPKYSQWNNSQHWTKIQSMKQVNIEPKYSQTWPSGVQCWLLFHWLYFDSMLTIASLTVFWFNIDYCFIDCILVQWWLLLHWLYFGSMMTIASLTVFGSMIEPIYSQWNNSQHWTKIQSMKQ